MHNSHEQLKKDLGITEEQLQEAIKMNESNEYLKSLLQEDSDEDLLWEYFWRDIQNTQ